eukprot:1601815-Pleurochrysis_carterae.AAC.8
MGVCKGGGVHVQMSNSQQVKCSQHNAAMNDLEQKQGCSAGVAPVTWQVAAISKWQESSRG